MKEHPMFEVKSVDFETLKVTKVPTLGQKVPISAKLGVTPLLGYLLVSVNMGGIGVVMTGLVFFGVFLGTLLGVNGVYWVLSGV